MEKITEIQQNKFMNKALVTVLLTGTEDIYVSNAKVIFFKTLLTSAPPKLLWIRSTVSPVVLPKLNATAQYNDLQKSRFFRTENICPVPPNNF